MKLRQWNTKLLKCWLAQLKGESSHKWLLQLDLALKDPDAGGDISSFITNGEWELIGNIHWKIFKHTTQKARLLNLREFLLPETFSPYYVLLFAWLLWQNFALIPHLTTLKVLNTKPKKNDCANAGQTKPKLSHLLLCEVSRIFRQPQPAAASSLTNPVWS